jgi:hypothetical protein
MDIDERKIKITITGENSINWFLDLTTATTANLPFKKISAHQVECSFENMNYVVTSTKGIFSKPMDSTVVRITAEKDGIVINFADRN